MTLLNSFFFSSVSVYRVSFRITQIYRNDDRNDEFKIIFKALQTLQTTSKWFNIFHIEVSNEE